MRTANQTTGDSYNVKLADSRERRNEKGLRYREIIIFPTLKNVNIYFLKAEFEYLLNV